MDQSSQDPHNTGLQTVLEGENDQQNQGKKSVMKKMRAKAKKMKDSVLSKRSHGHDQPDNKPDALKVSDDNDDFDEEGDDEEVEDPEIHGAPIYDSAVVKNDTYGKEGVPQLPTSSPPPVSRDFNEGHKGGLIDRPIKLEEDPSSPNNGGSPPNYQSKVTDPTGAGGEEIGRDSPIIKSFGKLSVEDDEPDSKAYQTPSAGIHDSDLSPKEFPESPSTNTGSGYTDKLSYATNTISDQAISAKNAVASKLGYGGANTDTVTEPPNETECVTNKGIEAPEGEANKGYGAAVYDKVAGAGTTVMSKFTGSGTGGGTETTERGSDGGVSVTDYLKPGNEDKALSDVISETLYKPKDEEGGEGKEKVTESEEVARTLGTGDEQNSGNVSGELKMNSGNAGVVDKVKSWFGKGNEEGNGAAASPKGETKHEQEEEIGERRLKESSN